jgi:hypothetical protein
MAGRAVRVARIADLTRTPRPRRCPETANALLRVIPTTNAANPFATAYGIGRRSQRQRRGYAIRVA